MLYFVLALMLLTVPGLLLLRSFAINKHKFIFSITLSYAYYVGLASLSKLQNLSLDLTCSLYLGGLALMVVANWKLFKKRNRPGALAHVDQYWLIGMVCVGLTYLLYRWWAGPYIEMPADLFRHLEYTQQQSVRIKAGFLGYPTDLSSLFKQSAGIWYSFYALVSQLAGLSLEQSLNAAMLLNGLLFLCLSYAFAWFIFGHFELSKRQRVCVSVLSTVFLFAHMGISVFAYARYYTLAPSMLNFTFYYAGVVLIYRLVNASSSQFKDAFLLLVFTLCAAIVHTQEALFIVVMGGLILGWHVFIKPFISQAEYRVGSAITHWWLKVSKLHLVLLLIVLLGFLVLVAYAYLTQDRPTDLANKVLQLSEQGPIFNRILFLNPEFQFVRVVTVWGGLTYILFLLFYHRLVQNAYIFVGMLSPLFTVFNPLFVDFFLRLDGPHTLWRMLCILPLNLVAAASVIFCFEQLRSAKLVHQLSAGLGLILLVALLFPLKVGSWRNTYSRLILQPVEIGNSYNLWEDLLVFLSNEIPEKRIILTDPVTGYAISAFTHHHTYNYKFIASHSYASRKFNFENYADSPLQRFKGSLLVVNERDGAYSETGADSRHWPAEIMKVSAFYSPALKPHLEANPQRFPKLWQSAEISVYRVD